MSVLLGLCHVGDVQQSTWHTSERQSASSRASNDQHQASSSSSSSSGGSERDGGDERAMSRLEVAHINSDVATIVWLEDRRKGSDDRQGAAIVFALCCISRRSCVMKAWHHSERKRGSDHPRFTIKAHYLYLWQRPHEQRLLSC